jgi:hypothetical protein
MEKHWITWLGYILIGFALQSCVDSELKDKALRKSNEIINQLDSETVYSSFSKKYFTQEEITRLTTHLRTQCDYQNRIGGFVNDFYESDLDAEPDKVNFLYEFFLRCDTVRIVLKFELAVDPQAVGLTIEPIETPNAMVDKDKQFLMREINTQ